MKNLRKISLILMITIISIFVLGITSKAATKVKITGDTLNIRKGPSTDTKVIAMLSKGVECDFIEEDGEWYKIKYKNYTGYVSKEYAELIGDLPKTDENNSQDDNKSDTTGDLKNQENTNNTEKGNDTEETVIYKSLKQNTVVRLLPLIYSTNLENINKNTQVILLGEVTGWSYIQTDDSCGWVRTEYLENSNATSNNTNTNKNEYTEKTAYISESSVNMRKGAGTSYNIIRVLSLNTQLTIVGEEGNWYKVKIGSTTGYVSKDYVSDTKKTTTRGNNVSRTETVAVTTTEKSNSETKEEVSNTENVEKKAETVENTETVKDNTKKEETTTNKKEETTSKNETAIKGTDIVAYAKKFLGYKYVYGGDGSNGTFDCSGFTMYVYKHFGIKIPHGANSQYKCGKGTKITKYSDLQVGDIVMLTDYETGVGIGHCGIYLGNDNFIHASTTCYAVEISSFKTIYKGRFYAGLRLI